MDGVPRPAVPELDGFTAQDYAFAKAWELFAPGLGGWTVHVDVEAGGLHALCVYPPLAYDEGFLIERQGAGVSITWSRQRQFAASLRDALLLICPLSKSALGRAEALSRLPEVALP